MTKQQLVSLLTNHVTAEARDSEDVDASVDRVMVDLTGQVRKRLTQLVRDAITAIGSDQVREYQRIRTAMVSPKRRKAK